MIIDPHDDSVAVTPGVMSPRSTSRPPYSKWSEAASLTSLMDAIEEPTRWRVRVRPCFIAAAVVVIVTLRPTEGLAFLRNDAL